MREFYSYEVVRGHRLSHDPLKAVVAPRPIGWISTVDGQGRGNLAPYSFFNGICTSPFLVAFSSEGWKDSVRNAQETREFVCNLATRELAEAVNETSRGYASGVDEMEMAGLASLPCRLVKPRRVAESPAALECRTVQVIQLTDVEGRKLQTFLTIGQVVAVHLDKGCLTADGRFDMVKAGTIARCGYAGDYAQVTGLFEMDRPR